MGSAISSLPCLLLSLRYDRVSFISSLLKAFKSSSRCISRWRSKFHEAPVSSHEFPPILAKHSVSTRNLKRIPCLTTFRDTRASHLKLVFKAPEDLSFELPQPVSFRFVFPRKCVDTRGDTEKMTQLSASRKQIQVEHRAGSRQVVSESSPNPR